HFFWPLPGSRRSPTPGRERRAWRVRHRRWRIARARASGPRALAPPATRSAPAPAGEDLSKVVARRRAVTAASGDLAVLGLGAVAVGERHRGRPPSGRDTVRPAARLSKYGVAAVAASDAKTQVQALRSEAHRSS